MLTSFPQTFDIPTAILIITAHWISDTISVSAAETNSLLFDYGGFPPEAYEYTYPAPGSKSLANRVCDLLQEARIPCRQDKKRGWDHGVFVPLMLMYPEASIPVVSMSLHSSLDPSLHINIGKALSKLREEGVLIVGSGASFHNFDYFFARDVSKKAEGVKHSHIWHNYLKETLTSETISPAEREERLKNWTTAPSAREGHKVRQEEHFIPLHVVAGAAGFSTGRLVGTEKDSSELMISNFEWR